MFRKHIFFWALLLFAAPPAYCGDLEVVARAFDHLAEASRSADSAGDAFNDAMRHRGFQRDRDYYGDPNYYPNYYRYDYEQHRRMERAKRHWKWEKERAKEMRKAEKKWRKQREKEMKRYFCHKRHHDDDDDD